MLLDLTRLQGPREHFERIFEPAAFDPPDVDYRVIAPVELSVDVQKIGGEAFGVSGQVVTELEMECGRCLEPFRFPVRAAFDLRYVPQAVNTGEGEREVEDEDLAIAYAPDGMLDLIELLREQFVLALPMKPLCSETCKGLCPQCGTNLNTSQCDCSPAWEDPRLAALKSLLPENKEN